MRFNKTVVLRTVFVFMMPIVAVSFAISLSVSAAPNSTQTLTSTQSGDTPTEGPTDQEKIKIFYGINDIQHYDNTCSSGGSSTTVQLAGSDNVEKALNYLMQHGFTLEQASGIVGNMQWESGSKTLNPQGSDGVAFGIAQWQGGRRTALEQYGGSDYASFDSQIHYLGVELGLEDPKNGIHGGSEAQTVTAVKTTNTPEEAALAFEHAFERSADTPGSIGYTTRQSNARKLYEQYKNGGVQSLASDPGSASSTGNCSSSSGSVNASGYAFPIALPKSDVSNGTAWPCPGICHHDGTPAFDLSKKAQDDSTENTPVIAIHDGEIKRLNNAYSGISGCQSFQLVGSDGWWYWYGHMQSASVQDGAQVKAGQQIAAVGRRACTGNGSYPHLHIDRGSPQGHYGGSVCCRDTGFTPLINQLYEELGGGTPSVL